MFTKADSLYSNLVSNILTFGSNVRTRDSDCKRLTTQIFEFRECPLVTIRHTAWRNALREWEWFMSGSDNIKDLHPSVHHWWKPWTQPDGSISYQYGYQFRKFDGLFDQIRHLINGIIEHPYSRRNVVTTWNPREMALKHNPITTCHGTIIQLFVDPDSNELSMFTYQRSADVILGLPHNWIQYWAFLTFLATYCRKTVGWLKWMGGDIHIYHNHLETARKIVHRYEQHGGQAYTEYGYADLNMQCCIDLTFPVFRQKDFSIVGVIPPPLVDDRPELIV